MKDNFKFIAPVSIEKSVGEDGMPTKMVIAGIASTAAQDFDGEFLNPKGFDLSYFKQYGFINWAHQTNKDPLSIVGRPSQARIDSKTNELFVEATLFNSSEKARQVYNLGEILEAEGLSLAFSIEGKVTKRDKQDPRKVLGAKITGCAITPTPKNNDSVANIIKGLDDNDFGFLKGTMSAYEEEDEEKQEKAMGTASVAPLTRESVDGDTKVTVEKLTKGQVMTILREDLPNTSDEMLEDVYKLILTIEKSVIMEKAEVNPESLSKAYETLGVEKSVNSDEKPAAEVEAAKSEETEESTTEENNSTEESNSEEGEIEKGSYASLSKMMEDMDYNKMSNEEKGKMKKMMEGNIAKMGVKVEKSETAEGLEDGPSNEAIEASKLILESEGYSVSKGIDSNEVSEATSEESIEKSTDADGLIDLVKGELGQFSKGFGSKFVAVGTLLKGLESKINSVQAHNETLQDQVNSFGKTSQGRKSVTVAAAIEKGVDGNDENNAAGEQANGSTILSTSIHKETILRKGDEMCGLSKGEVTDFDLANAVSLFESSNFCNPVLQKAMTEAGITLVK